MTRQSALDSVRSQAIEIARGWSAPGSPSSWALTAGIFTALGHDDELAAMAAEIPRDLMPALLFCAAACYLIGEDEPPGLVDFFPGAGGAQRAFDSRFEPAFRSFCLARRAGAARRVRQSSVPDERGGTIHPGAVAFMFSAGELRLPG